MELRDGLRLDHRKIVSKLKEPSLSVQQLLDIEIEIDKLQHALNDNAQSLGKYALENYQKNVAHLRLCLRDYKASCNSGGVDLAQYMKNDNINRKHTTPPKLSTKASVVEQESYKYGETIEITDAVFTIDRLDHCVIKSGHNVRDVNTRGSFTAKKIRDSIIYLDRLAFTDGNVFLDDCIRCIVLLRLSSQIKNSIIQVRLHAFTDCKVVIMPDQETVENGNTKRMISVTVEDFYNTVIHKSCQNILHIQDFGTNREVPEDGFNYRFDEFDIFGMDLQSLEIAYMS